MNCLLVGAPGGTTAGIARVLLEGDPQPPVTLLSDDTDGMLRLLDEPGLDGCECLWADATAPGTVDDALVHRRMLHGRPDVVVVVVDRTPAEGSPAWTFGELLVPRLAGTPLVVTGRAAVTVAPDVAATLRALADDEAGVPPHAVVPGDDATEVLTRAAELLRSLPTPSPGASAPLLAGHCGH
jgi:hypothetical protein